MRWLVGMLVLGLAAAGSPARAASERIVKVLPCFLDTKGRQSLRPSLYERDAYQSLLRKNPEKRSALRFDVQWKASRTDGLKLRVEARGNRAGQPQEVVLEKEVHDKWFFGHWSALTLEGEAYRNLGELTAWRATLWRGDAMVAEQRSFLW